jgi:hypothetical protein
MDRPFDMLRTRLLVYTHKITSRNRYIFRLFLKEHLGLDFELTDNQEKFQAHSGPKISYTQAPLADELFFFNRNLLFETGIKEQNLSVFNWEHHKVFFATGKSSALPFDPFACAFYLVSRYEEYLPHIRDRLDRFDAHSSLAWEHGFLEVPVVNHWILLIGNLLQNKYPGLKIKPRKYTFTPTIDIDNAYAYRLKGVMRSIGGYGRALVNFDFKDFRRRTRVLLNWENDPYDTYAYQLEVQKKYNFKPIYFFLLGDYGMNDKNISAQNRKFHELIRSLADYSQVGIHPSFGSNTDNSKLPVEISRLKNIVHGDITKSRQHFLMMKFPETYRNLAERDITDDYSMGFANEIGFRAGICTPFNFYDLDNESESSLKIHPFAVMDATLNLYMKLNPEEAIARTKKITAAVREVNGDMVFIWHNETLSEDKQWQGWRKVYESIIQDARPDGD